MAALADSEALIIDVRRNGGGSPVSVAHLVSYFLDGEEPVHINSFIWRNPGTETFRKEEFWSSATPISYAGKPAYVTAVRRMSEENARGEPNYDLLSPGMAEATRAQLESLQQLFSGLGPIESVTFVEVGPMGADIYEVEYENGSLTWTIALTADGKTATAGVRRPMAQP